MVFRIMAYKPEGFFFYFNDVWRKKFHLFRVAWQTF